MPRLFSLTPGRLQAGFVVAALLFSGGCAVAAVASGSWWLAPIGAILVLGGYAAALALEFVWLARRHGGRRAPSFSALVRAWSIEVTHGPRVFGWRQPFRRRSVRDLLSAEDPRSRGVVLVHGFFCNRALWNGWMRRLRALGIPHVALDLEPAFGSIEDYAPLVDRAVVQMTRAAGGCPPIVVAHSMGGLAVRTWLAADPDRARRVRRVVTIGSPHRGTWMARFARAPNGRQMRIGSEFLARLEASETIAARERFVCYWSDCDNIVFPSANATLPGADNRAVRGWAHVHLVDHPEIFATVVAAARDDAQMS